MAASIEENTQIFIVRIWREPREIARAAPAWRGVIEHVPSREKSYLRDLDEIPALIAPYLESMGLKLGLRWRVMRWLKRRNLW